MIPLPGAIILYIEEVQQGKRFMEIAREITLKKPVVAIKSGSSRIGQMTAASHTVLLSGSLKCTLLHSGNRESSLYDPCGKRSRQADFFHQKAIQRASARS